MPVLTRINSIDATVAQKQARRGTTIMEYLMMLSLIIVVCLIGISYVGGSNSVNMSSSSTAITKSLKKGS